jgi:hypothetical protein
MPNEQQAHASSDLTTQFEFARSGIRHRLARLRDNPEQPLTLHDVVTAAFEIITLGAGYVAATASEPRPTLDSVDYDLFLQGAHNAWEAETSAATDFARLLTRFISDTADWLDLPELTIVVPLLRAGLFIRTRQHFGHDCDLNPPLIQHWCTHLDKALEQGEPVEAILYLQAIRDRLLGQSGTASCGIASSSQNAGIDVLLDHDPNPSVDDEADTQHGQGTLVSFMDEPKAMEAGDLPPEFHPIIQSGVDLPTSDVEAALTRLSRQQADLLIRQEADPLRFAQVMHHRRLMTHRLTSTKQANATSRRHRLHIVPSAG